MVHVTATKFDKNETARDDDFALNLSHKSNSSRSKSDRSATKKTANADNSSSDGDSDSDSDSSEASDSKLQAKVAERRLKRAESNAAILQGQTLEGDRLHLTGMNLNLNLRQDNLDSPSHGDSPVMGETEQNDERKIPKNQHWKTLSKSVTTTSKLSSSTKHNRSKSHENHDSTEQNDDRIPKNQHWKTLSKAVTTTSTFSSSMKDGEAELRRSAVETEQNGDREIPKNQHWKTLSKSVTTTSKLSSSTKHNRSKSHENHDSETNMTTQLDEEAELQRSSIDPNNSFPDIKMSVSSDVRRSSRREAKRRNRSQSLTTGSARKQSRARATSEDRPSRGKDTLNPSDKKDHWKNLSSSIKDREQSSDAVKPKDNWKSLSNSLKAANDLKRPQSRARGNSEELNGNAVRQSKRQSTEDLTMSRTKGGANDLRKAKRQSADDLSMSRSGGSSNDLRKSKRSSVEDLARSRTGGSANDLRKSRRSSADDLTKLRNKGSRRQSADDDVRKSKRNSRGDDLASSDSNLRQSRRKSSNDDLAASDNNLRRSTRWEDAGDLRKSKKKGSMNRLNSM
jgi:hypothetical protein